MFTGLIRHQGSVRALSAGKLRVACPGLVSALALGDSVAVNGACLTVAEMHSDGFSADLLEATRRDTTLGSLPGGAVVNLEPALTAGGAFGGHFVQGHVDGVVALLTRQGRDGGAWRLEFELPAWLAPLVLDKGSIAIDGVSLTVQEILPSSFAVALIPTTWNETNLRMIQPATRVNIEADMLVKTVRHTVESMLKRSPDLTAGKLRELGYGA